VLAEINPGSKVHLPMLHVKNPGILKIPDLMQLTIDVLNPNKILHNQHLPALECEMSGLALSAKITQKKNY